ncbi:helix-turn-helix transcriptional regulator [Luteibacter sp. PPL201]|uniref:Helix-turn-helix transcriptional regulator n=1 Tax=Luteibacter sahnii TaxID=3021977 RepID=A0ABT6BC50_9GAMM|nr:helix-turn-helix transcriptional regulator [Luteibacter sp. PPL193]MDY1547677.1 helix-turn-helix transcriptional regulator [Luteibacter sp. PPL193]
MTVKRLKTTSLRARRAQKSLYRPENKSLSASFRQIRVASGLSQHEFGRRLGRNQSFVSAVETGAIRLDALQIRDWCAAAGVGMAAWLTLFESLLSGGAEPAD